MSGARTDMLSEVSDYGSGDAVRLISALEETMVAKWILFQIGQEKTNAQELLYSESRKYVLQQ